MHKKKNPVHWTLMDKTDKRIGRPPNTPDQVLAATMRRYIRTVRCPVLEDTNMLQKTALFGRFYSNWKKREEMPFHETYRAADVDDN